jgi:hypothetical protein
MLFLTLFVQTAKGDAPRAVLPEDVPSVSDGESGTVPEPGTPPERVDASCPYTKGEIQLRSFGQSSLDQPITYTSPAAGEMSCLTNAIQDIINSDFVSNGAPAYWDDRFVVKFWEYFAGAKYQSLYGKDSNAKCFREGDKHCFNTINVPSGAVCTSEIHNHVRDYTITCASGYFYFRDPGDGGHCQIASEADVESICGGLPSLGVRAEFIKSSPLSLLWSPKADINASMSFVSFPLNPSLGNAWYTWKASAETPLIVYNPSHDGKIRSGNQLFGNWTFGGKRTAALGTSAPLGQPWTNGYEALAALDTDGDGAVRGAELQPLGLWFDNNQDAVSQPGEVRSMAEAGVTALYYRVDSQDPVNGVLRAELGFERRENGRIVHGPSVDWFADTAATPAVLAAKYIFLAPSASSPEQLAEPEKNELPRPRTTEIPAAALPDSAESPFTGAWAWTYDEGNIDISIKGKTQGYLAFGVSSNDSVVSGVSIAGMPFQHSPQNKLGGRIDVFRFQGQQNIDGNGQPVISYSMKVGNSTLHTTVNISADRTTLHGTSTAYTSVNRQARKVVYNWTARRL